MNKYSDLKALHEALPATAAFDRVRTPRSYMPSRYVTLTRAGEHTTRSVPITTLGFGGALVVHVTACATTATVFLARVTVADVVVTDVVISIGRRLVLNRKRSVTIRGNARASDVDREVRLARS